MRSVFLTTCLVLAGACGPKDHPAPSPDSKTAPVNQEPAKAPSVKTHEQAPAAQNAPLTVQLQLKAQGDAVGLSLSNTGTSTISVAPEVVLERRTGSGFEVVNKSALTFRLDCKSTGCVTLASGGELLAPSWLGLADGERCGALIGKQPAGEYRLKVSSCDKSSSAELDFTWPSL